MIMEPRIRVAAVLFAGVLAAASVIATEVRASDLEGAALLVIDIQAFYYPGGMVPLVEPEAASANARRLVEAFRRAGRPVIHVQHLPKGVDAPDPTGVDPQYRIHPDVLPSEGGW